jgi:hypothetical protein
MLPFRRNLSCLIPFALCFFGAARTHASPQDMAQYAARTSEQTAVPSKSIGAAQQAEGQQKTQTEEQALTSAARELARKVAGAVGVDVQALVALSAAPTNLSSASLGEFQQGCDAFRDEMAKVGKTLQASTAQPPANVSLTLTLSENLREFLWVAQVNGYGAVKTFFVPVPRDRVGAALQFQPSIVLQKQFILSSPDPILDVALLPSQTGSPARLLVLQPERIALYAQENGAWEPQADAPITYFAPMPRDVRGRLQMSADGKQEEAVLSNVVCNITLDGTFKDFCRPPYTDMWTAFAGFGPSARLRFFPDKIEYMFPVSVPGAQFETVAAFASGGLVATLADGRALLFDGSSTPVATFSGWGSDIAALYSASRSPWPILVTGAGDWTVPDTIQAFDIVDHQAVPISGEIEFDGPITALWSEGENTALAVSRNLKTGMYEAYFIRADYNQ